jgi:hypothetical protein
LVLAAILWIFVSAFASAPGTAAHGGVPAQAVLSGIYTVCVVVFCARAFRGTTEPSAPRPWWKLTAGPVSSAVWGLLFAATALQWLLLPPALGLAEPAPLVAGHAGLQVVIALAFAHSALRMLRQRRLAPA